MRLDVASAQVYVAVAAALSTNVHGTHESGVAALSVPSAPTLESTPATLYDPAVHAETRLESAEVQLYVASAPSAAAVAAFATGVQSAHTASASAPQALTVYVPAASHELHALHVPAIPSL